MMKTCILAGPLLAVGICGAMLLAQTPQSHTFDQDRPDHPPSGFAFESMRQPDAGRWTVQRQGAQGFLVHAADASAGGYAMAVVDAPATNDVTVSVRLRFAGAVRSGGLVWRYQNHQNFHALILDLTRRELTLDRVASGNRVRLDVEDELELDPDAWHVLKVTHTEASIQVSLGGIRVFDERDRRDGRTVQIGRVGVIAAGRSEVHFDDFRLEPKRAHK